MEKFLGKYLGVCAFILVMIELLAWGAWTLYRYGGQHYYLRIEHSVGTRPLSEPVNYQIKGHVYRGRALSQSGQRKMVTFATNADNPGSFRLGQLVRVTVNRHYGVTQYHLIDRVPTGIMLNK